MACPPEIKQMMQGINALSVEAEPLLRPDRFDRAHARFEEYLAQRRQGEADPLMLAAHVTMENLRQKKEKKERKKEKKERKEKKEGHRSRGASGATGSKEPMPQVPETEVAAGPQVHGGRGASGATGSQEPMPQEPGTEVAVVEAEATSEELRHSWRSRRPMQFEL